MHMGRLYMEVCKVWRADPALQKTYWSKTLQVPVMSAIFFQIWSPITAYEEALIIYYSMYIHYLRYTFHICISLFQLCVLFILSFLNYLRIEDLLSGIFQNESFPDFGIWNWPPPSPQNLDFFEKHKNNKIKTTPCRIWIELRI